MISLKRMQRIHSIYLIVPILGVLALLSGSCSDPVAIDTPRRIIPVNIDSILLSPPFLEKQTDSLYAVVDGQPVSFDSEVLRPVQYNREVDNAWYLAVEGTRYSLKGDGHSTLSLRFDQIQDTGTYQMRGSFVIPKKIDQTAQSEYSGQYSKRSGSSLQLFSSASIGSGSIADGEIRVVGLDEARGVIVGTFRFTGYDPSRNTTLEIREGIFRLQLNR